MSFSEGGGPPPPPVDRVFEKSQFLAFFRFFPVFAPMVLPFKIRFETVFNHKNHQKALKPQEKRSLRTGHSVYPNSKERRT